MNAERFGGIERLYGSGSLARLAAAHVCVVGVGGVGSWTVEALARSGIGQLTLIDMDDVCVTNVNRQLPALDGQIGRPKISVLADRVALINPDCRVHQRAEFFTAATADELLAPDYSFVVDAIDKLTNKCHLLARSRARGFPTLTVGGAGGKRDGSAVRVADLGEATQDELLRVVRKKLRRDHGYAHGEHVRFDIRCVYSAERPFYPWANGTCSRDPEPGTNLTLDCASGFGTASFVTGAFGLAAAGEIVRLIAQNSDQS